MSRSEAELSVTERLIIQLVIYRTKNPNIRHSSEIIKTSPNVLMYSPIPLEKPLLNWLSWNIYNWAMISKDAAIWFIPVKNLHQLLRI